MDELIFLSTPSGWRATKDKNPEAEGMVISIHALRVEGDAAKKWWGEA